MPREITAEERREWAAKGAETRRTRRAAEWERFRADNNDKPAALEICRRIRDDEHAADADRLKAIELIHTIKGE